MSRRAAVFLAATALATACNRGAPVAHVADSRAISLRDEALRSARVWRPPATPIARVDFAGNPAGPRALRPDDDLDCRFELTRTSGTTPKFECKLPDGDLVKIKYGGNNPELHAEVAATRLLTALGFGDDRMYVVRRVRCAGCPAFPFESLKCYDRTGLLAACFAGPIDYGRSATFDPTVVERHFDGRKIETAENPGWAWYELDRIDPAAGGSSRAEVDALRLMAVFLSHWDNKAANQRLVCLPGGDRAGGGCTKPFAFVQDLGATFGPVKLDLPNWRRTPVWADRATCTVSMKSLPYGGATFPDRRISEAGRQMLTGLLEQLSSGQLTDLFTASRVIEYDEISAETRSAAPWVEAFRNKIRQIADGGPCPQAP